MMLLKRSRVASNQSLLSGILNVVFVNQYRQKDSAASRHLYTASKTIQSRVSSASYFCYNLSATLPDTQVAKGVVSVTISSFVEAVAAGVIAYYICQWLDGMFHR